MSEPNEATIQSGSWSRTEVLIIKFLGTVAFAFLTILSAQVRIPLPFTPVPMTLQTFVAPLAGGFLGAGWGSASMLLYLALGLIGGPVFAQASGGLQFLYAPTAGFVIGMILAAAIVGLARDRKKNNVVLFAALVASHVVIFVCGTLGFMVNTGAGWNEAFAKAVAPFLVGDSLKIVASYLILISYNHFRKITNA